jgi:tetratricopeptide (TPR) repeat protein
MQTLNEFIVDLYRNNRIDKLESLGKALKDDNEINFYLSAIKRKEGNPEAANQMLRSILSKEEGNKKALRSLAWNSFNIKEKIKCFEKLIKKNDCDEYDLSEYAKCLYKEGSIYDAHNWYTQVISNYNQDNETALLGLVEIHLKLAYEILETISLLGLEGKVTECIEDRDLASIAESIINGYILDNKK